MIDAIILDNLFTIIIGIFSLGGAWFVVQFKLAHIKNEIDQTNTRISSVKARVEIVEKQQISIGRIETDLKWLIQGMEDIKKKLNIL